MTRCITCGQPTNRNKAHMAIEYEGESYLVCCPLCQAEFEKDPQKFILRSQRRHSKHLN
jgi:YHS domain-containing protein